MDYQMEELLPIVSELTQKYTGYESTSITYEKAQSLMEAVLFCLNEFDSSCTDSPVRQNIAVKEQYDIGVKLLREKVNEIREIFNEMSFHFEDYGVKCLSHTVKNGIPRFLEWYDVNFGPQDAIITLDYPLLTDCGSLTGADAVYSYIRAIQTEQLFLNAFERDYIVLILEQYNPDYCGMIENICSIVLTNMIGHIAIRKPMDNTGFLHEEYLQLSKVFGGKSVSEIEKIAERFIGEIVRQFYQNDKALLAYLSCETKNIAARIDSANQQGSLGRIFVL